jgi:aspartate/methionine/tyrosine aminotransferase
MKLARNAQATAHSGIREIVHQAIVREGVIRLEVGESTLPTPAHIVEGAARDAAEGYTRYTASAGYPELRDAICEKLARVNGIAARPDNVVVTAGGVQGLFLVLAALCDPGDVVLVPDPAWPNYEMICQLIGARATPYDCRSEHGFVPDLEEVERRITRQTRAIVLNSPNNPTGSVYPDDVVRGFVELAERRGIVLVSDEAYDELYSESRPLSPASLQELEEGPVVSIFSFSKTYAMTGWRVGYALASRPLIGVVAKLQEPTISCASSVSQRAALAALTGPQQFVNEQRRFLSERRHLVGELLRGRREFTYRAEGAFYLLLDISPLSSRQFALHLLERENVAVAPGSAFGERAEGFVRICYGAGGDALLDAVSSLHRAKVELLASDGDRFAVQGISLADA